MLACVLTSSNKDMLCYVMFKSPFAGGGGILRRPNYRPHSLYTNLWVIWFTDDTDAAGTANVRVQLRPISDNQSCCTAHVPFTPTPCCIMDFGRLDPVYCRYRLFPQACKICPCS